MNNKHKSWSIPLHIYIVIVSVTVLLIVGGTMALFLFQKMKARSIDRAERSAQSFTVNVARNVSTLFIAAERTVDVLAGASLGAQKDLRSRWSSVESLRSLLEVQPFLNSIFLGYEDSSYLLLRKLDPISRARLHPPLNSVYNLQSIVALPDGRRYSETYFLDQDLNTIEVQDTYTPTFDPRARAWYVAGQMAESNAVRIGPFSSSTSKEWAIAFARKSRTGPAVVTTMITFNSISAILASSKLTASSEVALVDAKGTLFGYHDWRKLASIGQAEAIPRAALADDLPSSVLPLLVQSQPSKLGIEQRYVHDKDGRQWMGILHPIRVTEGDPLWLAVSSPIDELFVEADQIRANFFIAFVLALFAVTVLAFIFAKRTSRKIDEATKLAERLKSFDFSTEFASTSRVREVCHLTQSLIELRFSVRHFLEFSQLLHQKNDLKALLDLVLNEIVRVTGSVGGVIYLKSDDRTRYTAAAASTEFSLPSISDLPEEIVKRALSRGDLNLSAQMQLLSRPFNLDNVELSYIEQCTSDENIRLLMLPFVTEDGELLGLISVVLNHASSATSEKISFVTALCDYASVAINHQRLIGAQRGLINGMIQTLGAAIDAKSSHTSEHCKRVPEITMALAEAATQSSLPRFEQYTMSELEREALYVASWLHDCGKVTTPEFVLDKATKLETLYNRIHEVRAKFEIVKRDAEIECWKQIAAGGDKSALLERLSSQHQELNDEFAFIAHCNQGKSSLSDSDIERLKKIASRTWLPSISRRLGLSWEEEQRQGDHSGINAPEPLLDDKPEHLIRNKRDYQDAEKEIYMLGNKVRVPEYRLNLGELYNLSIRQGTLTTEERFIINDHIVQTIVMLKSLPFPEYLSRVPEIAGGHHERIDGKGYPLGLSGESFSIEARFMAVADIFEALTSHDRPYKTPKTLSETLNIMKKMAEGGHIDSDVFRLLIESGVFATYAENYLLPSQRDISLDAAKVQYLT